MNLKLCNFNFCEPGFCIIGKIGKKLFKSTFLVLEYHIFVKNLLPTGYPLVTHWLPTGYPSLPTGYPTGYPVVTLVTQSFLVLVTT